MLRKEAIKAGPISLISDIARFEMGYKWQLIFLSRLKNWDLNIAIHKWIQTVYGSERSLASV